MSKTMFVNDLMNRLISFSENVGKEEKTPNAIELLDVCGHSRENDLEKLGVNSAFVNK